ncbi:hypothetical protein LAZ67_X002145 [Cordylochernes scorpioides]|uniref:Peptidase aspartic putative domain-containing protein n=1 Tax=Cordylochernes scorpioides TaxID=51811 RepID=A0ABY6LT56_9ARAC|nr:hypothetical protein LAZ67_X002145 [Cordylochernes scorpioides]
MILANRRITVREVAEDLNISIGSCHSIFINDLGMRRVAAKFVPKLLNSDQKQHRMNIANENLDSVRDDPNLLLRVITGDEAWVYGYDVETKAQSSQWKLPHEPRPKKARQVRSNVKVLLTVFFDCRGVVHHEFLPQGRTSYPFDCAKYVADVYNKSHDRILLSTALIKVKSKNGVLQTCRALIDTGSQRCLITNSCRKKLNLPLAECKTTVFGLGNKLVEQSMGEVSLQFSPHFSNLIFNANPIVIDKITSELPNFFREKDNWPYLKNLLLTDPNFDKSSQIDLVIGAELAPCLFNGKVRFQNLSGPTACGSKLGWLLTGKILLSGENSNQDITMFASEEQNDFLKKLLELESVPSAKSLTREEISCEEIYINNLKILEDGRYTVGLPFRTLPTLGESRINALKRFLSLERKLQKSPSILKQYCDFMDEYLLINHMELIPSYELDTPSGQCYYIPHHCVFKEQSTTTKLRVVFDASCKTSNGKSLNDFLHVGPKLQQDIFNILIRFRTRPIAFSGDIEKMYRQVRIDSRDCYFQRILRRKNPSEPLLDYRLLTVKYGLSLAPYLAMRTLHQLARDKVSTFPVASKIVQTDFYVDDLLSGADTIEELHVIFVKSIIFFLQPDFL